MLCGGDSYVPLGSVYALSAPGDLRGEEIPEAPDQESSRPVLSALEQGLGVQWVGDPQLASLGQALGTVDFKSCGMWAESYFRTSNWVLRQERQAEQCRWGPGIPERSVLATYGSGESSSFSGIWCSLVCGLF